MNALELYRNTQKIFRDAGFDSPDVEAAYLVAHAAGLRRFDITFRGKKKILTPEEETSAQDYLTRRLAHEPFQYIDGWTEFRNLRLAVGPGCLIPRPETECLIDLLKPELRPGARLAELGTGSGAIALAFADERPDLEIYASEISPDALFWARKNLETLAFSNVTLCSGNLFDAFPRELKFDAVAANLPYIPESARPALPPNVRDYEPEIALFSPDSGLALVKRALENAPLHLTSGASLVLEIGEEQGDALAEFARNCGYHAVSVVRDCFGTPRFLRCLFHEK